MADDEKEPGVVRKETTEEVLTTVKSGEKYRDLLNKDDLSKGDKLKVVGEALTDVHIGLVGSGKVSTVEAKNFRYFVKKEFDALIGASDIVNRESPGILLSAVVWAAFDKYAKYKLQQIEDIQKRKAARIQKILDRRK